MMKRSKKRQRNLIDGLMKRRRDKMRSKLLAVPLLIGILLHSTESAGSLFPSAKLIEESAAIVATVTIVDMNPFYGLTLPGGPTAMTKVVATVNKVFKGNPPPVLTFAVLFTGASKCEDEMIHWARFDGYGGVQVGDKVKVFLRDPKGEEELKGLSIPFTSGGGFYNEWDDSKFRGDPLAWRKLFESFRDKVRELLESGKFQGKGDMACLELAR
ncbi:MAG: hypothetical protein HYY20_06800 [Candidatus Tectomicrobia bacterium]|uniref:Uncharacterized protein n=1 Tax=Tectimicrobiota bacterium TaxID=2528274 RepID=A0A932CNY8_UNCTE|nr:hypothetical protein [Candidatus Tectomicrobia bacterium]